MSEVARTQLSPDSPQYPAILKTYWTSGLPPSLTAIGNADLLREKKLGLFCSSQCPGNVILRTYDLMKDLAGSSYTLISGFQSPMEKECLRLSMRGKNNVILYPARRIETMRIPVDWKPALRENRLLILSPFLSNQNRMTRQLAEQRNEFVAVLADTIFIAHAVPGSKTEAFALKIAKWDKPLYTIDVPANKQLMEIGAKKILMPNH